MVVELPGHKLADVAVAVPPSGAGETVTVTVAHVVVLHVPLYLT